MSEERRCIEVITSIDHHRRLEGRARELARLLGRETIENEMLWNGLPAEPLVLRRDSARLRGLEATSPRFGFVPFVFKEFGSFDPELFGDSIQHRQTNVPSTMQNL